MDSHTRQADTAPITQSINQRNQDSILSQMTDNLPNILLYKYWFTLYRTAAMSLKSQNSIFTVLISV